MIYDKTIDDTFRLKITGLVATVWGDTEDETPVTVTLANEAQAEKMIAEFEDGEGELMYAEDAVFGEYEELHKFRP